MELRPDSNGVLNQGAFTKFSGEFKVHRNRVGDWTPAEEYQLLTNSLPPYWLGELKKEEDKRRRSKYWVKMSQMPDITVAELKDALDQMQLKPKEIKTTDGGFLVLARDEDGRAELEKLTGMELSGKIIRVSRHQPRMTGDEIIQWMDRQLRVRDEVREVVALQERRRAPPRFQDPLFPEAAHQIYGGAPQAFQAPTQAAVMAAQVEAPPPPQPARETRKETKSSPPTVSPPQPVQAQGYSQPTQGGGRGRGKGKGGESGGDVTHAGNQNHAQAQRGGGPILKGWGILSPTDPPGPEQRRNPKKQ